MALKPDEVKLTATVISNTKSSIIKVTEDKLIIALNRYILKIKKSKDWIGATATSLSILATLLTSDFHDAIGISKAHWEVVFGIALVVSICYVGYTIYNRIRSNVKTEDIVAAIKGEDSANTKARTHQE